MNHLPFTAYRNEVHKLCQVKTKFFHPFVSYISEVMALPYRNPFVASAFKMVNLNKNQTKLIVQLVNLK